ncbi:MAG: hypothetical protein AB1414_04075 [bacterium]
MGLFEKVTDSLDRILPQLDKIAAYKDPLVRKSLEEESISFLASESIFCGLIKEGSYIITPEGEKAIEKLKSDLNRKGFLKDNITSAIFGDERIIQYHDFFKKTLSLFKKLFNDDEIKEEAEKRGVTHSTLLFVAAVFALQKAIEFHLVARFKKR